VFRIAVLVSGNGTNLQAIADAVKTQENCEIYAVITDNPQAYALKRAEKEKIKTYILDKKIYRGQLSDEILKILKNKVDLIILAGYLSILKGQIIDEFKNRIINIHPSLIPSFCGKGMYGLNVHKAVIEYGVKVTGCTVHIVDGGTDTGPVIIQKTVNVEQNMTPEKLQEKVLEFEHQSLTEAIKLFAENKIEIFGRKVIIKEKEQ